MKLKIYLITMFILFCSLLNAAAATNDCDNNNYNARYTDLPWSVMFYHAYLAEGSVLKAMIFQNLHSDESLYAFEVTHEIPRDNMLRRYVQPLISTVSIVGNVAYIDDPGGPIYEFNPFLLFRWEHFPWDRYLVNTLGLGWGISYDTRVSTWERQDSSNTKQLLNYLAFEVTLALPKIPQWQLVTRVHHRSGAFGLYGADNTSSNYVGFGIRYSF